MFVENAASLHIAQFAYCVAQPQNLAVFGVARQPYCVGIRSPLRTIAAAPAALVDLGNRGCA
eukprot:2172441-Lingulodinium_polyedra.AAC.1